MKTRRSALVPTLLAAILLGSLAVAAAAQEGASAEGEPALRGNDPVLLTRGEEVPGDASRTEVRGRFRYRFASAETRELFLAEPERYEIQLDGRCAKMPAVTGRGDLYAVYEGKIYVFGTPGCREDFLADPATYVDVRSRSVAILVFDGVELLDFAGPGEVFASAARGRSLDVFTVGVSAEPVVSQGFVTVTPRYAMAESPKPDVLIVPGGHVGSLLDEPAAMRWIREVAEDAEVVMSVCNGAFVLGAAGLLDGKGATTHHGAIESLRRSVPTATVYTGRRFVDNGRIVTSAGVSAGIDAALHVVSRLFGAPRARNVASHMEYAWEPEGEDEGVPAAAESSR